MKPLYYNSGTFGFVETSDETYVGWIGQEDPTLRPNMRELAVRISAPVPQNLAGLVRQLWESVGGPIWFTPGSYWAYELQDGGEHYMPALLRSVKIDPQPMEDLNQGSALEFCQDEIDVSSDFLRAVIEQTQITDYGIIFPNAPIIGLVHHHRQIWWRVKDATWQTRLRELPAIL